MIRRVLISLESCARRARVMSPARRFSFSRKRIAELQIEATRSAAKIAETWAERGPGRNGGSDGAAQEVKDPFAFVAIACAGIRAATPQIS